MDADLARKQILHEWEERAETGAVTIRDVHFRDLQTAFIARRIPRGATVIDIGCGNGDNTAVFAQTASRVLGVDFSAGMIRHCIAHHAGPGLEFQVGDATDLAGIADASYDVAVLERCLINLPTPELQRVGLGEAARVVRSGGLALIGEMTMQGHERLNAARALFGLQPLMRHWHNLPLDEEAFASWLAPAFELEEMVPFSTYEFLSKVVHAAAVAPEEPRFDSQLNRIAKETSLAFRPDAFGDLSKRRLYVLRRR